RLGGRVRALVSPGPGAPPPRAPLSANRDNPEMVMSRDMSAPATVHDLAQQTWRRRRLTALKRWWEAYVAWRTEQAVIARLRSMSDAQLKDIGLARGQIEAALETGIGPERHRMDA